MNDRTTGELVVGLIFITLGIIFGFRLKWRRLPVYICLLIGSALTYSSLLGGDSKGPKALAHLQTLNAGGVSSIVVYPWHDADEKSLVQKVFEIHQANLIDSLCLALTKSQVTDDNFMKSTYALGEITINETNGKTIRLEINKSDSNTSLKLFSSDNLRWYYGRLEAKVFGEVLQRLIANDASR